MNSKGQLIITDILLYLIMLTIILSLIIYATTVLEDNQVTRINNKQLNDILENILSTLTKTSGNPTNWEYLNTKDIKVVGLKSNTSLLSYNKLTKLKQNNQLLDNYFPTGIEYSLTLYPKNNPNHKELISGKEYINSNKQIQSKDVQVVFDYGFKISSFNNNNDTEYCPYLHDNNWKCKTITINESLLSEGKYYILTNTSIEYIISNTYSDNITGQTDNIVNINNQLKHLQKNVNQTIYLHIKTGTNNTYLVYDSNGRENQIKSVLKPQPYILNLKVAT